MMKFGMEHLRMMADGVFIFSKIKAQQQSKSKYFSFGILFCVPLRVFVKTILSKKKQSKNKVPRIHEKNRMIILMIIELRREIFFTIFGAQ